MADPPFYPPSNLFGSIRSSQPVRGLEGLAPACRMVVHPHRPQRHYLSSILHRNQVSGVAVGVSACQKLEQGAMPWWRQSWQHNTQTKPPKLFAYLRIITWARCNLYDYDAQMFNFSMLKLKLLQILCRDENWTTDFKNAKTSTCNANYSTCIANHYTIQISCCNASVVHMHM